MNNKSQLKLIGVRPLKGCAPHIRKVLYENTTYFLYNEYEVDSRNNNMIIHKDKPGLPKDFFCQFKSDTPLISISAIVGKNGDGKSSIIELIMRILNNFAYASGFLKDQEELQPVLDLHAIFYYAIGDDIHFIKSKGNKISSSLWNEELDINSPIRDTEYINKVSKSLFYTQISNYSLYAYNSKELKHENASDKDCWINGIFHKNDAYQTPIVLNPWRYEGNIDINKENYLSKQRLVSLYVEDDDTKSSIRNIDNKKIAQYLIFYPYEKSKLVQVTFEKYFIESGNIDKLEIERKDAKGYGQFNSISNFDSFISSHINKLIDLKAIIENNREDFEFAKKIINEIGFQEEPDFKSYLDEMDKSIKSNLSYIKDKGLNDILNIPNFFKDTGFDHFNILQLQRVILVIAIRHLWNKELKGRFDQNDLYEEDILSKAKQYVIYKTISIFLKYPQYRDIEKVSILDRFNSFFQNSSKIKDYIDGQRECFIELLKDIYKEKSHITLKLRQTLNYINYHNNSEYIKEYDIKYDQIKSLNISGNTFPENSYIIELQDYKKRLDLISEQKYQSDIKKLNTIELLPPPIFNADVIFQQINNNQEYSLLSQLSSGERQLLHNVSSVIYHLQNINSVSSSDLIKYRHVNLIFEEIELYFHPEYQRRYINYLLTHISKAKLDKIESINICFVTHSPFILSDIPKNNVLFLTNGLPVREMQEDTFGSNIHTLLQNGFFLNGVPIGEFARNKINNLFKRLHEGKTTLKDNDDDFYDQILLVSEPFIRTQLLKLYNDLNPRNKHPLETQLAELKKEIEDLKQRVK